MLSTAEWLGVWRESASLLAPRLLSGLLKTPVAQFLAFFPCLIMLSVSVFFLPKSSPPKHGYRLIASQFVSCEGVLKRSESSFRNASLQVDIWSGADMLCLVRSHYCVLVWVTLTLWKSHVFLPIRWGLVAETLVAVEHVITNFMKTPSYNLKVWQIEI